VEAELVPAAGLELDPIRVEGISRTNPLKAARALARAAAALQTGVEDVAEAVERVTAGRAAAEKELRVLREQARAAEGRELAAAAGPLVVRRIDGRDPASLRALALEVVAAAPTLVLLGSLDQGRAHFVFARGAGVRQDANALLQVALPHVAGRGGGKPDLAQGGGPGVEGLDAALQAARERAGEA
jgi:alanyl-tRNA synthetase